MTQALGLTGARTSNLLYPTEEQIEWLKPHVLKCRGKPRVDDHRVLGGIFFISRNSSWWCDTPREYFPTKFPYN